MTTGDRIKAMRIARGMTQGELAEKIGVKTPAIYKYENNLIVNLKRSTLEALAKALDCDPVYLLGMKTTEAPAEAEALTEDTETFIRMYSSLTPEQQAHNRSVPGSNP